MNYECLLCSKVHTNAADYKVCLVECANKNEELKNIFYQTGAYE